MRKVVLGIFAHPDDAEFMCSGTLSLLHKAGWSINIASLATGDKGTAVYSRDEIIKIRNAEATRAARILSGTYFCAGFDDLYIFYDHESINRTSLLIRKIHPSIVFTSSPADYMVDHEVTSLIVQTACFSAGIKNLEIPEKTFEPIPYLYYCDPMEGKDKFGNLIYPSTYVDITDEIMVKEDMLKCHESQRNWLLSHHRVDEYILTMKRFAHQRGKEINTNFAEGFRQHLGHGFQQNNIIKEVLGSLVTIKNNQLWHQKQF